MVSLLVEDMRVIEAEAADNELCDEKVELAR